MMKKKTVRTPRERRADQLREARANDLRKDRTGWPTLGWGNFKTRLFLVERGLKVDLVGIISGRAKGKKKPVRVMDLGCGAGTATRQLAEQLEGKAIITGTSLARLKEWKGQERKNLKWRVVHARKLAQKFPKNHFDIIYSHCGLMHEPKLQEALENIKTVLKPGGLLIYNDAKNCPVPEVEGLKLIGSEESSGYIAHRLKKVG